MASPAPIRGVRSAGGFADKREDYRRIERNYGTFNRSFTLPSTVEMGNVTAQTRDGILRIFLPKKAETKPRQIKVTVGSGKDAVVKQ